MAEEAFRSRSVCLQRSPSPPCHSLLRISNILASGSMLKCRVIDSIIVLCREWGIKRISRKTSSETYPHFVQSITHHQPRRTHDHASFVWSWIELDPGTPKNLFCSSISSLWCLLATPKGWSPQSPKSLSPQSGSFLFSLRRFSWWFNILQVLILMCHPQQWCLAPWLKAPPPPIPTASPSPCPLSWCFSNATQPAHHGLLPGFSTMQKVPFIPLSYHLILATHTYTMPVMDLKYQLFWQMNSVCSFLTLVEDSSFLSKLKQFFFFSFASLQMMELKTTCRICS